MSCYVFIIDSSIFAIKKCTHFIIIHLHPHNSIFITIIIIIMMMDDMKTGLIHLGRRYISRLRNKLKSPLQRHTQAVFRQIIGKSMWIHRFRNFMIIIKQENPDLVRIQTVSPNKIQLSKTHQLYQSIYCKQNVTKIRPLARFLDPWVN